MFLFFKLIQVFFLSLKKKKITVAYIISFALILILVHPIISFASETAHLYEVAYTALFVVRSDQACLGFGELLMGGFEILMLKGLRERLLENV